jgi:hypothetical protein
MMNQAIEKIKNKHKINSRIYGLSILSFAVVIFGVSFFSKNSTNVYFNKVMAVYENVSSSIEALNILESYRHYWTNNDVIEIAKHTLIVEESYKGVKNIMPPKDLITIHQEILQVFKLFKDSMPIYRTALDKSDSQLYSQSMDMILKANDKLIKIIEQFE